VASRESAVCAARDFSSQPRVVRALFADYWHRLGMGLYLLSYIAIAALYFGLWLWQPLVAFLGFLLATIFHWGQGDVRFLEIFLNRQRIS
jgi:hypothetical protein